MTLKNRDLFHRDPTETKIPNDGVAKVVRPETEQEWDVLRWELSSFVCDGQYAKGLSRIVDSFLEGLSRPQQPAAWVSGFYGSGKSHLVRVLEYLWHDVELPGGERARDLVSLPDELRDGFTELSAAGKRQGGLWSAAGTLASGKSDAVRLAFLSVLFHSAGLPEELSRARFAIWARENGYMEKLRAAVEAEGRSLEKEIHDLYVSPLIAGALLETDPSLGASPKEVRDLIRTQFPPATKDVTDEEMFSVMEDVLRLQSAKEGKFPLTLIVLDEMQQYIGEDNEKALAVQNIVEGCSSRFESQVLFVATGQNALTATPTLQKLIDRFRLPVELSDTDVETVVRQVVLRKDPEHVPELKATLEGSAGEIDRHLGGTSFASRAEEKPKLVPDYPVLPSRWRLWSEMLRAVDRAGKSGVVRSQLGLIHGGACAYAERPLGTVIGADYLFFDDKAHLDMLMSGVLLREVDDFIQRLMGGDEDSVLKGRLCALVFLISQMSDPVFGGDSGLRATAPFLSDLLVEDLAADGDRLRKRVPELLEELVEDGRIVQVEDGYRLLTQEDAEWRKEYGTRRAAIRDDAGRISQLRSERLMAAVNAALGGIKLVHGSSGTPRKLELSWAGEAPGSEGGTVPVWVQDEWSVTEATVRRAAAEAGDESPVVFVLLPRRESDRIGEALASHAAAADTLRRPTPQTDEGKAAQRAMQTLQGGEDERLNELFAEVVAGARVFQGGGGELTTSNLREVVETAARRSLVRLFPKFGVADHASWDKVVSKARDGAPDALEAVGHRGAPTTHPVCKEVLATVSAAGTTGSELLRTFTAPPYGWPREAVYGALLALFAAGNVRAAQEGKDLAGPKELPQTQIGRTAFYKEDEPPSVNQRLAVQGLLTAAGIDFEPNQEGAKLPALLQRLEDLAGRAGGEPPLPEPVATGRLTDLSALGGNQQLRAVADAHSELKDDLERWQRAVELRERREAEWRRLRRLLGHAAGLPVAAKVERAVAAIEAGRQLLEEPDPMAPLLTELAAALRDEVKRSAADLAAAQREAVAQLEGWEDWSRLEEGDREAILREAKLLPVEPSGLRGEEELLAALDETPLSGWRDSISLVPGRRDRARQEAAMKLEPESVAVEPPSATIKDEEDLEEYVGELRERVRPHLEANKTVII